MSRWVGMSYQVDFRQVDATALDVGPGDYDGVHRALKRGGIFTIYDIIQGERGDVLYLVPCANKPSISHLAKPREMRRLLESANFKILDDID
jgi:hypothetical protein